ncbi:MAG: sigma 54-interacting transcriptional regulator [Planctomycetes bacterium]|nr:sigma 54-interacting transcriptional regulator [Planctomycetota bacterium]
MSALDRAVSWKGANKSNGQLAAKPPAKSTQDVPYCAPVSAFMREVLSLAEKIAPMDVPILIQGETGVGKKLLGRIIHRQSGRADGPFVHVACATLPDSQLESELFGGPPASLRENQHRTGLVEQASGGTLLLEEVSDLPLWMQIKLLDVIDRGWFPAPGSDDPKSVDVRVIVTTSCDLEIAVADGRFHRGFYDNVNLAPIRIPALRERPEDIKAFASYFMERLNERRNGDGGRCRSQIADEVWNLLLRYPWPGNVRQLASVITRATLLNGDINTGLRTYLNNSLPPDIGEMITVPLAGDLKEIERYVIREVVRRQGGNKAQAARALGMHRRTLYRLLENGAHS